MGPNSTPPRRLDRSAASEEILDSWKEIARYLNRNVRTLQRWEHSRALPVHRLPGGTRPGVYALKSELDDWRQSRLPLAKAGSWLLQTDRAAEPSIAVLPFANLSPQKENEYFADGLADEIITGLMRLPGLRVTARTSAFAFRGQELDVREIGVRLNVATLLEGSFQRSGNRIRISAQLVDASSGYHLWSERYDRTLTDAFALQDELSQAIVSALRTRLVAR